MTSMPLEQEKMKISVLNKLSSSKFTVYLVKSNTDSKTYAMKVFPYKKQEIHSSFTRELAAVPFDHNNIAKIIDFVPSVATEVGNQIIGYSSYILMELAPYGDLADFVMSENFRRDDKLIRTLFRYICDGVEYMHSKKFAHMDLKLENILIGENFVPKITDFETLKCLRSQNKNKFIKRLGTINYRAPEIIKQECRNGSAADIFSLGILLFILQIGFLPYFENQMVDGQDLHSLLIESNPEFFKFHSGRENLPSDMRDSFKDLIFGLTKKDVSKRMIFEDVKKNEWYNGPIYSEVEYALMMKARL